MTEESKRPQEEENDVQGHDWSPTWKLPYIPQEDATPDVEGHSTPSEEEVAEGDEDVEGHHIRRPGDDPRINLP